MNDSIYPAWRKRLVHWVAKALGVLVRIEGRAFGSSRIYLRSPESDPASRTGPGSIGRAAACSDAAAGVAVLLKMLNEADQVGIKVISEMRAAADARKGSE